MHNHSLSTPGNQAAEGLPHPLEPRIRLIRGDISTRAVDVVVNAANEHLSGGSGVDGAIHLAAGPELDQACQKIVERSGGCPTGQAVITPGFNLAAPWIIHTVGPVWEARRLPAWARNLLPPGNLDLASEHWQEDWMLACAYESSLCLAVDKGLYRIAFPAISTGLYGFPGRRAARIALKTIMFFLQWLDFRLGPGQAGRFMVELVCITLENHQIYQELMLAAAKSGGEEDIATLPAQDTGCP